jgi:hypothetical protein
MTQGVACVYPDANDAARLKADPIHKLLVGCEPLTGHDLASQPTPSHIEDFVGPEALYRKSMELASCPGSSGHPPTHNEVGSFGWQPYAFLTRRVHQ